jgi:heptosyltransferase I
MQGLRILIIKTSSLGDVIHTLPALTDAVAAIPGLTADWVVEEAFAEIPSWHPAVENVIPVAVRRWRRNWWQALNSGELAAFRRQLRVHEYDVVIDAQGLVKSAIMTTMARGPKAGLDRNSIKEPLASRFYNQTVAVPRAEHAVQRVRQLFAAILSYVYDPQRIDYGLENSAALAVATDREQPLLMFLHGTTWVSKHWPEAYWRELAHMAADAGYGIRLPWGNLVEQERAQRIAEGIPSAQVLDRLTLAGLAGVMRQCQGVLAVDTGLGHLSAALNRPTVSIYGATNPFLSGTFGYHQLQLKGSLPCSPCMRRQCEYQGEPLFDQTREQPMLNVEPACYRASAPAEVFVHLQRLIGQSRQRIDL